MTTTRRMVCRVEANGPVSSEFSPPTTASRCRVGVVPSVEPTTKKSSALPDTVLPTTLACQSPASGFCTVAVTIPPCRAMFPIPAPTWRPRGSVSCRSRSLPGQFRLTLSMPLPLGTEKLGTDAVSPWRTVPR